MNIFPFDNNVKCQIRNVMEYAQNNIFQVDDILDMMNKELLIPGDRPEHLVLVPVGRWICYYLINHPVLGRWHYFQIKPDASGHHPDKPSMEYIIKEFGVDTALLDKHITIDTLQDETKIIIPLSN